MSYKFYGYSDNTRTIACLVAAKYEGLDVKLVHTKASEGLSDEYKTKFALAHGKTPAFEGEGVALTETLAIATYIASIADKAKLLGRSKEENAEVLQWMSFANQELLPTSATWWLTLLDPTAPYNKTQVTAGQEKTNALLNNVEKILATRTFLVGDRITLADIVLSALLIRSFKLVLDAPWRAAHPNVTRHFTTLVNQPEFIAVAGKVELCEKAAVYTPPKKEPKPAKAPAAAAPKADKKAKKEDDDEDEPSVPAEPKAKHPCEALGPAKCFPLDEWKRQYSNLDFPKAMEWLESKIDETEYTFWRVTYKYNEELTQVFMSANLIGGFHTRLEGSRKYLFGSAGVYGKSNASKIQGCYLLRGDDWKGVFEVGPDWESYEFSKLDFKKDIDFIKGCWNWDNTFDGLEYADGKVFK